MENKEMRKQDLNRTAAFFLLAILAMTVVIGCKSHSMPYASPNDPYAENAPKTPEEEAYYNDVYSGDWKKTQNPLGYFGLGKYFVSTAPPDHWSMTPPAGAKTMEQVYQENYQRQMAAQAAGAMNPAAVQGPNDAPQGASPTNGPLPNYAAGVVPAGAHVMTPNDPFTAGVFHEQPMASGNPNAMERVGMIPSNAMPNAAPSGENIGPNDNSGRSDSGRVEEYKEKNGFMKWLDGWSFSLPSMESNGSKGRIFRAQEPAAQSAVFESSSASASKSEQSEEAKRPESPASDSTNGSRTLPADSRLGESWRSLNRAGLRAESARKHLPQDEYIADGGDDGSAAYMTREKTVRHLDPEDAVAGFETADGRILVEPSNRVHIYSPRFGSVRQVLSASSESQGFRLGEAATEVGVELREGAAAVDVRSQESRSGLTRGKIAATGTAANQPGGAVSSADGVKENIAQTRLGDMAGALMTEDASVLARLRTAGSALAVGTWGEIQEVSVEIEKVSAQGMVRHQAAEAVFTVQTDSKTSRLSLFKMASKKDAAPGEVIEFALRYENVGGERIENVTILDNLSARLEYIPDSAKSSRNATFTTRTNQTGSLLLKWEINEPLEIHQYGVVSFLCRVR